MPDAPIGDDSPDFPTEAALEFLRDCARQKKAVVPLVGAGLSVGAGIPPLAHVSEHLVRVYRALSQRGQHDTQARNDVSQTYLAEHGWPGRHDINAELHARFKESGTKFADLAKARQELFEKAIADNATRRSHLLNSGLNSAATRAELIRNQLPVPALGLWSQDLEKELSKTSGREWLLFLQYLSRNHEGYHPELVDLYFSRLTRGRSPSSGHHFMAFLAKVFGWKLILTTNFDDLLETALRAQGLSPVVFELAQDPLHPDEQLMPDPRLLRATDQVAILKLHGGTHGLHAGYQLDQAMPEKQVQRCLQYLEQERAAALLVLGYGSREERIVSLINAWQDGKEDGVDARKVVWVFRSNKQESSRTTLTAQAEDPGLFLHELHQRILFTHPSGLHPYTALHSAPRRGYGALYKGIQGCPPENASRVKLRAWYLAATDERTERDTRTSTRLWFSMQDFPNCASFVSNLVETLEVADRNLPIAARPWYCPFPVGEQAKKADDENDAKKDPDDSVEVIEQRYRELVAAALTRYPYRIAIDMQRAFVGGLPTIQAQRAWGARNDREEVRLFKFLAAIVELGIGESQLAIALPPGTRELHGLSSCDEVELIGKGIEATRDSESSAGEVVARCRAIADARVGDSDHVVGRCLLQVCVAFRRPRSLAGLAKVTSALLEEDAPEAWPGRDEDDPFVGAYSARYEAIVEKLRHFVAHGLLAHLDGGFYSMCSFARLSLFAAYERDPSWATRLSLIEGRIADYYCTELYEHSRDPHAFFEYAYHRAAVAAIKAQERDRSAPQDRMKYAEDYIQQFEWLTASIERDGDEIAARGCSSRLLFLVERIERRVGDAKEKVTASLPRPTEAGAEEVRELAARHERLEERLLAIKASTYRRTADFSFSLKCHSTLLMLPESRSSSVGVTDGAALDNAERELEDLEKGAGDGSAQDSRAKAVAHVLARAEDDSRAILKASPTKPKELRSRAKKVIERCKEVRRKRDDPSSLLQRASRLLEVAICISSFERSAYARAFVDDPSERVVRPDHAGHASADEKAWGPMDLVDHAEQYALAALSAAEMSNGGELHGFATMILVRCKKARLKHEVRHVVAWDSKPEDFAASDNYRTVYDNAGSLLRSMRPGPRTKALQCSIRCAYARTLYLRGDFSHASAELNRAHPLAARAGGPEGLTALVEYHLHRAEYCLLRATRMERVEDLNDGSSVEGRDAERNTWLLGAATTALNEAEASLRRGDRSAVSWRWLFQLRAWCAREQLRLVDRSKVDPHHAEALLSTGLRAVAGALLNADMHQRSNLATLDLWTGLCEQHHQLREGKIASWAELDVRAGLSSLSARHAVAEVVVSLSPAAPETGEIGGAVSNMGLTGIGLALHGVEASATGTLFKAELRCKCHGNCTELATLTVRKARPSGFALVSMPRKSLVSYLHMMVMKSRVRTERLRAQRSHDGGAAQKLILNS